MYTFPSHLPPKSCRKLTKERLSHVVFWIVRSPPPVIDIPRLPILESKMVRFREWKCASRRLSRHFSVLRSVFRFVPNPPQGGVLPSAVTFRKVEFSMRLPPVPYVPAYKSRSVPSRSCSQGISRIFSRV